MSTRVTSIVGTLRADGGTGIVRMDGDYATDVSDLWDALTNPQRLARWVARVEGDLRAGGIVHTIFTSEWEGDCRIEECEPEKRLLVTSGLGEDDPTIIEVTLTPVDGGTRLVIEERGLPLGELPAHGAGWQTHVEDLGTHLAGDVPTPWVDRLRELMPEYRQRSV